MLRKTNFKATVLATALSCLLPAGTALAQGEPKSVQFWWPETLDLAPLRQHAERFAIERLQRDDRELRIDGAAGTDDVFAEITRMHVSTARGLAEGIDDFFARQADPAAVVRVLPVIE